MKQLGVNTHSLLHAKHFAKDGMKQRMWRNIVPTLLDPSLSGKRDSRQIILELLFAIGMGNEVRSVVTHFHIITV